VTARRVTVTGGRRLAAKLLTRGYRALFVGTMFVVCLFNFADRTVFAVLAQPIKQDLHLTDFQLGILQGFSFALLYAGLGLPLGRLAERASRIRIVGIATIVFSIATTFCGLAGNLWQMMLARIGVGVGEAGFTAPTSSLVADHFPRERRASTMALVMLGTPVGTLFGALVGGVVAGLFGWRMAFFALGLPGALTGIAVMLLLTEPPRGLVDGAPPTVQAPPDFAAFLAVLRRKRALLLVIIGGGIAGFGMTSISQFLAVFLARAHHMSVREAATAYGLITAIALGTGLLVGSFGTDWLAKRDARWPAWGSALGLCIAPLIYWLAFSATDTSTASVLLTVAGAVLLLFYGPTSGMIQNMLEPRMRATGAAVFAMLYTLIGAGLGPAFVGFMSDHLAERAFPGGHYLQQCPAGPHPTAACLDASIQGIRGALMVAVCLLFLASLCYFVAARRLREDIVSV
jgi:predicted MFS family arabinose efflux permease